MPRYVRRVKRKMADGTIKEYVYDRRVPNPQKPSGVFKNGVVYVVQCGRTGPIKIGYTTNLIQRVRDLEFAGGHRLQLRAAFVGSKKLERQLHDRFEDLRLHGEWFAPNIRIAREISALRRELKSVTNFARLAKRVADIDGKAHFAPVKS